MEVTSGHQTFVEKYPLFAAVNRCSSRKFKSNTYKNVSLSVQLVFVNKLFCYFNILWELVFCGIQENSLFWNELLSQIPLTRTVLLNWFWD